MEVSQNGAYRRSTVADLVSREAISRYVQMIQYLDTEVVLERLIDLRMYKNFGRIEATMIIVGLVSSSVEVGISFGAPRLVPKS